MIGAGAPARGESPERAVADAVGAVTDLVAGGAPRRRAVDVVARLTGIPRNQLYRRSL